MKMNIKHLLTCLLFFASSHATAYSSSTNYQLGYSAFDGGGGIATSSSYDLNASAIGTVGGGADGMSSNYMNNPGTQLIDDDGDGLDSGVEQEVFGTDPNLVDTDMDTLSDLEEVQNGSDPLDSSSPFSADVPLPIWSVLLLLAIMTLSVSNKRRVLLQ